MAPPTAPTPTPTPTPASTGNPWRNGFDDAGRNLLRIDDPAVRAAVQTGTDVGVYTLILAPPAHTMTRLGLRGDWNQFWRVGLKYVVAHGVSLTAGQITKGIADRERPYQQACSTDPTADKDCNGPDKDHSFYSLHTSEAVVGATLHCNDALKYNLYGSKTANIVGCAAGYTLALGVGTGRMAGDKHWGTDVLVGAGVGVVIAEGTELVFDALDVPSLKLSDSFMALPMVAVGPNGGMLGLSGTFQ